MVEPLKRNILTRNWCLSILVLSYIFIAWTGMRGVDFGRHWDERHLFRRIQVAVQNKTLLPGRYHYPSMCFDLAMATLLADGVKKLLKGQREGRPLSEFLLTIARNKQFHLLMRKVTVAISALVVFWVFFMVSAWRNDPREALLAGLLTGLSWELAYHSRWYSPDPLLTQFGALSMMFVVFSQLKAHRWVYLKWAAVSAGFAFGTKYPGVAFILPVLLATHMTRWGSSTITETRPVWKLSLIFIGTYLLTTPGTLLQTPLLIEGFLVNFLGYLQGSIHGHRASLVGPIFPHALLIVRYFFFAVFSSWSAAAAVFFLLSILGAVFVIKEEKGMAVIFLTFPAVYFLYFSLQKVMIPRNYLLLIPFAAVLSARGLFGAMEKVEWIKGKKRWVLGCAFFVCGMNAFWLWKTSESIRTRSTVDYSVEAARYLNENPDQLFVLSARVQSQLVRHAMADLPNITRRPDSTADALVTYTSEIHDFGGRSVPIRFDFNMKWFGSKEVNLPIYPNWPANDRIVVLPMEKARKAYPYIFARKSPFFKPPI